MTQAGIAWEDVMLPELKTQRWQQLQQRLARLEGESYREIVSLLFGSHRPEGRVENGLDAVVLGDPLVRVSQASTQGNGAPSQTI